MKEIENNRAIWRNRAGVLAGVVVVLAGVAAAHAAPLSYPTNENIYLSSPQITLTIRAGSVADGLTASATSVLVTLSQTTGGNFTLLSPL